MRCRRLFKYSCHMKLICSTILLLCLTILLLVLAMTSCDGGIGTHMRIAATRSDLTTFSTALEMFHGDCGRYPTTTEGLEALVARSVSIPSGKWHKYLDVDRLPLDPWSHHYIYISPGLHNTNTYDLFSCGADGKTKSGGDDPDDINNWNKGSPLVTWDEANEFGGLPTIAGVGVAAFLADGGAGMASKTDWGIGG